MFSSDGSVVPLTRAAGGIGARLALGLAEAGAAVACLDRAGPALEQTQQAVEQTGGTALALVADVTREDELQDAVAQAEQAL